ncbi:MAG TPA: alpha/beta hydrolase fold domain-containing protein [Lichenihabitans sp.]|jgi:acetyl esterase|nr:alpha/beta hydrolase fold domain-containing protein [Lichenihabitans sp.]
MSVSWASSSPEELRVHHARDAAKQAGALPGDVTETVLPAQGDFRGGLLFAPRACAADTVVVYFHGGGFVAGSPETHRCVTAWLAQRAGLRVLSARYRLAPDHPFPAQLEDAVAACRAALAMSDAADPPKLFLAGDSAGACVALWGLRGLDRRTRAGVEGLVLFYGGYGLVEGDSIARYGTPDNGLDSETLSVMYGRLGENGLTWPLDFAGEVIEPAYVLAAGLDAVFDDSARLVQALGAANPASRFVVADGQDHGFLKGAGKDPVALRELDAAARWMAALARRSPEATAAQT